ncbi:MAG: isopentenyl-diphosphate Delta-isomerase [Chlamydiales bacterium]|nr:isopentenyl-diphosphate Delta-isomerase [Chlamydiales bacterium]
MEEQVVLVDDHDVQIGTYPKQQAHIDGLLHRALSVFIFNSKHEILIHQRAHSKYHSGGLWTNACCSHPRVGEAAFDAANRRLKEEMGITCSLTPVFTFIYKAQVGALTEHEFDHVFIGTYDGPVSPDPEEVAAYKWIAADDLQKEMQRTPELFTPWFHIALPKVLHSFSDNHYATGSC